MATRDKEQSQPCDQPLERQIITIIGEVQYLVHPQRLGHVSTSASTRKLQDIIPVTGLTLELFNSPYTFQAIEGFDNQDDVYMYGFNERIVIIDQSEPEVDADNKIPPYRVHGLFLDDSKHPLRPGPYFIYNEGLHQAWRLYPDKLRAFNFGIIPRAVHEPQNSVYDPVTVLSRDGLQKAIAVPSRLYYDPPSRDKPLSGVRFVVDDLFSLKGVKTTLSHEAWATLYSPCPETSYFIKQLIGLGAVVVGKTKASQFAVLHTAWVDVSSPKNPRADGYQEALGSSPGAGSALAGYMWVDCAVGIDTLGGFMETAEWYGLFALRLSHYWPFVVGVNLASSRLSAIAFMSRSLERVEQAAGASIISIKLNSSQQPTLSPLTPSTIIFPKDLFENEQHRNQKRLTVEFTKLFKAKANNLDLGEAWEEHPPPNAPSDDTLQSYMKDCAWEAYCHDFGKKYRKFLEEYTKDDSTEEEEDVILSPYWDDAVNSICFRIGRFNVFVISKLSYKIPGEVYQGSADASQISANYWDLSREKSHTVSVQDYHHYCARIVTFTEWFGKGIAPLGNSIVMLPTGVGHQPMSRVHSPSTYAPTAHRMYNWDECLASILQRPQLVLPLGRTFFKSRITRVVEALPLCISMMGDKDSDLPLIGLTIKVMKENGLEVKVDAGPEIWREARWPWQYFHVNGNMVSLKHDGDMADATDMIE
ncbi:amidase signature domain-containing protein [Triangularia setosa]|uniref:Amidase signature domain-containing protein n=1 Tax=Triangularia setosa TaxID=2587417 RepID=A0AAN6WHD2_9PEZI|nr:amidase signature domain-containing protein [Podospora setosa]